MEPRLKAAVALLFVAVLIINGCQQASNQGNQIKSLRKINQSNIDQLIPKNIVYSDGITLTEEIESKLRIYDYINSKFIIGLNDFQRINETLYNTNLFKKDNGVIQVTNINNVDGKYISTCDIFSYEMGKIRSVINTEDRQFEIRFNYTNDWLYEIKKSTKTVPLTIKENHKTTTVPQTNYLFKREYKYQNNKMLWYVENRTDRKNQIKIIFSESSIISTGNYFIKKEQQGDILDGWKEITGFKNGVIKVHAVYSKDESMPMDIYIFDEVGDILYCRWYFIETASNPVVYNLNLTYEIQTNGNNVERIIKKHRGNVDDYYYQYQYTGNNFLGYNIFLREYSEDDEESEIEEYQLEESFLCQ